VSSEFTIRIVLAFNACVIPWFVEIYEPPTHDGWILVNEIERILPSFLEQEVNQGVSITRDLTHFEVAGIKSSKVPRSCIDYCFYGLSTCGLDSEW
jgi:hypothetical protein